MTQCFVNIKTFSEKNVYFIINSVLLFTMTTKNNACFFFCLFLFFLISGMWWLVYCEGEGMFCLLCRVHNTKNKYNKQNIFNLAPSTNYKHSAVSDHARASGHTSTVICELERRNSSLANQYKVAHEVADKVTYNAFLSSYWLGKEEVANKKLLSLIDLEKHIGVTEMREFKNTSERSQREMRLLLGQLIKEKLIQRVKDAKWFSILVDEVTDCATLEQLLIYVGYVDEEGKTHFDFLEVKDVLETSESADSETLTRIITEELKACGLNLALVCGFGSDGATVMTAKIMVLVPGFKRCVASWCAVTALITGLPWHAVMLMTL